MLTCCKQVCVLSVMYKQSFLRTGNDELRVGVEIFSFVLKSNDFAFRCRCGIPIHNVIKFHMPSLLKIIFWFDFSYIEDIIPSLYERKDLF